MIESAPFLLTLRLAFCATLILFAIAVPLAHWLSGKRTVLKIIAEAVVSLPLVLPPTVIGFYLLLAFSPGGLLGHWLEQHLNLRLVFSFGGLLIASILYSLPFMVQPIKSGFSSLPTALKEASYSLGKTKWYTLRKVVLPNIKPSLMTAIVLTFAHTVGEFGVVLMIGGNIPGKTRTASIAIYDEVESFHYASANRYSAILLMVSFVMLLLLYSYNRKADRVKFY